MHSNVKHIKQHLEYSKCPVWVSFFGILTFAHMAWGQSLKEPCCGALGADMVREDVCAAAGIGLNGGLACTPAWGGELGTLAATPGTSASLPTPLTEAVATAPCPSLLDAPRGLTHG